MLSIDEAFRKFKSRLELNEREQKNASQRQNEVRDYLQTKFGIARSFLTGSYARYTKTKPLKDIDIFFVLKDSEKHYHGKAASVVLDDFHSALVEKYGSAAVRKQARSINVDFGVHIDAEDNTDYRVVSWMRCPHSTPATSMRSPIRRPESGSRRTRRSIRTRRPQRTKPMPMSGKVSCAW